VERNKVLLEKVDSLTKSVSVVKFSWCREAMGHCFPRYVNKISGSPVLEKKTTSGKMLGCYILCGEIRRSK
jgi:hypothetical protein